MKLLSIGKSQHGARFGSLGAACSDGRVIKGAATDCRARYLSPLHGYIFRPIVRQIQAWQIAYPVFLVTKRSSLPSKLGKSLWSTTACVYKDTFCLNSEFAHCQHN